MPVADHSPAPRRSPMEKGCHHPKPSPPISNARRHLCNLGLGRHLDRLECVGQDIGAAGMFDEHRNRRLAKAQRAVLSTLFPSDVCHPPASSGPRNSVAVTAVVAATFSICCPIVWVRLRRRSSESWSQALKITTCRGTLGATLGATPWGLHRQPPACLKALFYGAFSKPFYYGGEGGIRTPDSPAPLPQTPTTYG
ncbi:hypothetical protein ABIF79_011004 [Bradyrhizobium japonicum]